MKSNRLITVVLVVMFALVIFVNTAFCDCTGIIVGKGATVDGSILIARNEDFPGNWAKHIIVVPGETYKAEAIIESATGFVCPQLAVTYKYVSVQDWDATQGRFNEGGINEYQVGVSSTTTARQNDKAKEADPKIKTGIGENIITALVLERAKAAKEGVKLVGDLVEEYGSSEIFGMAIGDPNEVWLLEVGGGHHWVAVRIPDNSYVVEANALRIGEVDLSDTANFMGSVDLITFAEEHGLYDSASGEPFDFAKAYGTAADLAVRNYRRVWGGQHFFTSSAELDPEAKRYPLFLIPDEKITPQRVMSFLRYHYQGTDYDTETPAGQGERAVGISNTLESHVLQLRSWLPNPIGGVMWLSVSAPRTSVYVPYYSGITEVPSAYQLGTDEYDSKSAYWAFRTITSVVFTDFSEMAKDVQSVWEAFESREFAWQPIIEKVAIELHDQDETLAIEFLTNYSNGLALNALDKAFILGKNLLTKMAGKAKGAY
jgi:dipeptidase